MPYTLSPKTLNPKLGSHLSDMRQAVQIMVHFGALEKFRAVVYQGIKKGA